MNEMSEMLPILSVILFIVIGVHFFALFARQPPDVKTMTCTSFCLCGIHVVQAYIYSSMGSMGWFAVNVGLAIIWGMLGCGRINGDS